MVLGTAQFGMDYGIANINGKPKKKEVFDILDLAWEKGIRRFDSAPGYGSEMLLGEFISANGLHDQTIVLTKIPSLKGALDYEKLIITNLESSLNNLGCTIDILFFHDPADSRLLLTNPQFFKNLLINYPVSTHGVSVYEPQEIEQLLEGLFELAFQFPFNVLDRRFEQVNIPKGKRYARSLFLQGLLASPNDLRSDVPIELLCLQKEYHDKLADHFIDPVSFAISFVAHNSTVDYFLVGVDSAKQLQKILDLELYEQRDMDLLNKLQIKTDKKWFDPRIWN
jgi:aryl-alcohol dehydrogenase-like predicted oxidoreductase